jgi:hypothetical protein
MRSFVAIVVLATALGLAGVAGAQTSGYHFSQSGFPLCTDIGAQLECTAEIAGLGQHQVLSTISAPNATATDLTCVNKGGNEAPGQNPAVPTTATGSALSTVDKNGRAVVDVFTDPVSVGAKEAGCPNGNWKVVVGDVIFTTYTLTITQGNTTLYVCEGTFGSGGSTNGATSTPTCTPSN